MTISSDVIQSVAQQLITEHGTEHRSIIEKGVLQVAERWTEEDGTEKDFSNFCLENFISSPSERQILFERFLANLESLYGNLHRIYRDFNWHLHVDTGEILPFDRQFATYDVFAHVTDDFFKSRLAFIVLLNFPLYTLEEKETIGKKWSRREWAELRLVEQFSERIPAEIQQKRTHAYVQAEEYIYQYNIYMENVVTPEGEKIFPQGLRLISHWDLRDEIKAQYANPDGLKNQKLIFKIMERIVDQSIPRQIINNRELSWEPFSNTILSPQSGTPVTYEPEARKRYEILLQVFKVEQLVDQYTPQHPSLIQRSFERDRELSEEEVERLFTSYLSSPVLKEIADIIKHRLGRELYPFDIWYYGFKEGSDYPEEELDRLVQQRYPNLTTFQKNLSKLLQQLGFSQEKAEYLNQYIMVDPARGAGHAMGAKMRGDHAHLRTRVPSNGMNYKGFNTAMHELGHCVEQVFSLNEIDYYTLEGVPNTAFTEAMAFIFQARDLDVLGITDSHSSRKHLLALHNAWQTMEIAGVSLLDMYIWRWMYEHPDADAQQLKEATMELAKKIWNKFYAPIFGITDQFHLAIYSHIIYCGLYTPDYTLGHLISYQLEEFLEGRDFGKEVERICRLGCLAPQRWMEEAVGSPLSAQPLLNAAERAIHHYREEIST
ncbi:MAG: hypothetical protein D6748_08370 [Calditrichaeota bacterium]|nr:MAG: hypothetical protein D6748_08370 [Calditrichota bacterium]